MSTQAIQAGEAFIQLNIKGDEFQKSLNRIGDSLDAFGTQTTSLFSTLKGAFAGSIAECGQLGDAISLTGMSITGIGVTLGVFDNLRQHLHVISILNQQNTFTELQKIAALRMSLKIQSDHVVVQKAIRAVSYLSAIGIKVLAGAQWVLNTAFLACPIGWLVAGLAGIGAAIGGTMWLMGSFSDSTKESAENMEKLCKQYDAYRDSAKKTLAILEELNQKESLNAEQKTFSFEAYKELQDCANNLGISLAGLGISYDSSTGKINATEKALASLKNAMRTKEVEDLNNAIQKQQEYLDELNSRMRVGNYGWKRELGTYLSFGYVHNSKEMMGETDETDEKLGQGKIGYARWAMSYLTLGWVDNAEEIQAKIDETREKLQENLDRQKTVVDFSAEYKENEKKLKEIYAKEAEASRNALQVKIDGIQKEFAERETILKQLIQEMEVRKEFADDNKDNIIDEKEKANFTNEEARILEERHAALARLNAEQERRIQLLKDEQAAKFQKFQDDYEAKKAENAENSAWKTSLDDPQKAYDNAKQKVREAEYLLASAVEAGKNAGTNITAEELETLQKEVEKAQKNAEKWYARREEAAAKVAEHEKKIAEEAQKAADEAREKAAADKEAAEALQDSRLDEIEILRASKEEERAGKEEQKEWDSLKERDSARAEKKAKTEHDRLTSEIYEEYAKLKNLANSGASDKVYQSQLKKVQDMEREIDLWADRLEDVSLLQMSSIQENTELAGKNIERTSGPDLLTKGSADSQRKFLELQQALKDPAVAQIQETNFLLKRGLTCWENMEGQFKAV